MLAKARSRSVCVFGESMKARSKPAGPGYGRQRLDVRVNLEPGHVAGADVDAANLAGEPRRQGRLAHQVHGCRRGMV
jgi:hypothetical protein